MHLFRHKPILGILGGIGSGKSFIADLFAELSCLVIHDDATVRAAYADPAVQQTLRSWWDDAIFLPDGSVDRRAIAQRIFTSPQDKSRLEQLLHPLVAQARHRAMEAAPDSIQAFIWDTPLLMETGLDAQCDALIFVDAPPDLRLARVRQTRSWDAPELLRREKFQMPLDKKRQAAHYVVDNTASDAGLARRQVRDILSRILAKLG